MLTLCLIGMLNEVCYSKLWFDLARSGIAPPLVVGLSAVSFHLYSAADMSIVPWSAGVNIKQFMRIQQLY